MVRVKGYILSPIGWVKTLLHKTVESGIRPICDVSHKSMLHGIVMNIIQVFVEIFLIIANLVFPKTLLPNRPLSEKFSIRGHVFTSKI